METMRILGEFQPKRLSQARTAKKLTMSDLADRLSITRQAISSFENGTSKPSIDTLRELGKLLGVSEQYFFTPIRESEGERESAINFRSLKSSQKKSRSQAGIYLEWLISLFDFASDYISLPESALPDFQTEDFRRLRDEDIENLALETRKFFGLGDGPIPNLCKLLENKGVVIGHVPLDDKMDGLSAWFNNKPVTLINKKAYHARGRFDLAHELFHLIAHRTVTQEELEDREILNLVEAQAHRFAGAFLAPQTTFLNEVYSINYDALIELKRRWGISAQAIVMRLNDLEVISDYQKMRFFSRMNATGERTKEKLDGEIEPERPMLLKRVAEFLDENKVMFYGDFSQRVGLPEWFIESVSGISPTEAHLSDNVVQFVPRLKESQ